MTNSFLVKIGVICSRLPVADTLPNSPAKRREKEDATKSRLGVKPKPKSCSMIAETAAEITEMALNRECSETDKAVEDMETDVSPQAEGTFVLHRFAGGKVRGRFHGC